MYEKVCNFCKELKPETEYHKRSVSPDGIDSQCRECRRRYQYTPGKLENAEEKNRKSAEEILTNMGYELYNEENPVYLQFKRRLSERGVDTSEW